MQEYPVSFIVGRRGGGKSLYLIRIAEMYYNAGIPIFSNFDMTIPHYTIDFDELATFPDYLHDCVILIDEIQVGAHAYDFWSDVVRKISDLIMQIRKLQISMYCATQDFNNVAKPLRKQTDYVLQTEALTILGVRRKDCFKVDIFDRFTDKYIRTDIYNGARYYNMYNTKQLILNNRTLVKPESAGKILVNKL